MVRTTGFHPVNRGSIPRGVTMKIRGSPFGLARVFYGVRGSERRRRDGAEPGSTDALTNANR